MEETICFRFPAEWEKEKVMESIAQAMLEYYPQYLNWTFSQELHQEGKYWAAIVEATDPVPSYPRYANA